MKIQKEQLVILVVAAVLITGFAVLRYIPLAKRTKSIKSAKIKYEAGNKIIQKQARQVAILNAKMEQVEKRVGDFDAKIPVDRKFALLCDEISEVMDKFRLQDQLIQPGQETGGVKVNAIPISIECSGSLNQVFDFFKSIEQFERVIRVEKLDMLSELKTGMIRVKADAKVYYRPGGYNVETI